MHNFVIAGIAGTALMTAALYLLTMITGKNYKVTRILATMITNHTTAEKGLTNSTPDRVKGIVLHYLIGVLFAFVYFYLWNTGTVSPGTWSAVLLGAGTGVVATCFWYLFFRWHPNPPAVPVNQYAPVVGLAHTLFGWGVYLFY